MTKSKRLLSVVLTVCMLASMFSMTFGLNIFAADNTETPETSQTFTFDEAGLNDFLGKTYTKSAKDTGAVANPKFTSITDEATLTSYGADQWGLTNLLKVAADRDDTARFSVFANSADYDSAKSIHEAVKQANAPKSMSTYFANNLLGFSGRTGPMKNTIRGIITGASTTSSAYEDADNSWTGTKYVTTFYGYAVEPVFVNDTVKLMVRNFNRNITEIEYDETSIAAGAVNTITHPTNAQETGAGTVDLAETIEGVTSQDQLNPLMKLELKYTGDDAKAVEVVYTGKYTVDGVTKEFTGTLTDTNASATDRVFGFWENDVWYHTFAAPAFGETTVNYDVAETPCTHENTELVVVTPATCTENGVGKKVCKDCGETVEENVVIKATGHNASKEWTVITEAVADKAGERVKYCTVCNEVVEREEYYFTGFFTEDKDQYYYNNGQKVLGEFVTVDNNKYYLRKADGQMLKGIVALIGGELYQFDKNGKIVENTKTIVDNKCFYGTQQLYGWQTVNGNRYYFSLKTGEMVKDYIGLIGSTVGKFDENGVYSADENLTIKNGKCYALTDTAYETALTGWQQIYGKWFYFRKTGGNIIADASKQTSKALIGGQLYTFTKAGYSMTEVTTSAEKTADNKIVINSTNLVEYGNTTVNYGIIISKTEVSDEAFRVTYSDGSATAVTDGTYAYISAAPHTEKNAVLFRKTFNIGSSTGTLYYRGFVVYNNNGTEEIIYSDINSIGLN